MSAVIDRPTPQVASGQELIIKLRQDLAFPAMVGAAREMFSDEFAGLPIMATPVFPPSVLRSAVSNTVVIAEDSASFSPAAPDDAVSAPTVGYLSSFLHVSGESSVLEALVERLQVRPEVESVYIKPLTYPAMAMPGVTPSFESMQGYLDPAPGGIDARYAWTLPGGDGRRIMITDIEGDWQLSHEDLGSCSRLGAGNYKNIGWRNHGTAVLGVIGGSNTNSIGITGISPGAAVRAMSIYDSGMNSATAIAQAAISCHPGDILLIELHRPGPRFGFATKPDQTGYIAIEWWEDDLAAIQFATSLGVIVVEASGNGAEDLDDPLYNTGAGFSTAWSNPFARGSTDSGAILVGAGAPPSGTYGPDRSKLDFSNYGVCVDSQGWGREVVTTGYGDLYKGAGENQWYTNSFSGTSSASPIVVGALACVQGFLLEKGVALLSPSEARSLLRSTGSTQQPDASGNSPLIGSRPDLRTLIPAAASLRGISV